MAPSASFADLIASTGMSSAVIRLAAEGEQLFGLIGKLLQVENGLRQAVVETLGEAADVRRRALGIPRPPVPKI